MENPSEQVVVPPWQELGLTIVKYLLEWPFMCHAGLVLMFAWIASYSHLNVALVCTLGFLYLYQEVVGRGSLCFNELDKFWLIVIDLVLASLWVMLPFQIENRQREKLNWKIRHEENKKASKMRLPEGETVRWMNEVLEKLWPIFLEDFSSQMLLVPMTSFLDRFKPWSAKKLILQNLSLGKTPPIVTMVRLLDETVDGDDLALEASLEWMAAKDMAAVLAVQVRRRLGLGIWTPLHLCKLQLEGKVKVGMKFKNGWPVIERIRLCFAKAPYIDVAVHPLYDSGVDVSELPGIASWLDRLVAGALAQSLVEPNIIEIDMEKLMKDVMRPQGPAQPPRGDWFSMRGSPPAGDVIVNILEATDLRVGDLNGTSDPFVKVMLNGTQQGETKVIWKTLNPKWNEKFRFSISSWDQPNTVLVKVRDKDRIFDDQLGYQIVEINQYRDGKEHDIWLPLKAVDTGKIHLVITVFDGQTDSQSSEDTSNTNSTTLEKADQMMSLESDRSVLSDGLTTPVSPGYGLSRPPAASPKDRVPTRQRLTNLKSGKALSSDPASEDSSGKKVGRQRSGFFSSSRSSRKLEARQLGADREKPSTPSEENSPMASSRLTSTHSSTPKEAEVADPSTDDTTTFLHVGFGESGAVKVCQLGDIQPTPWPSQRVVGSKRSEGVSNSEEGKSKTLDQALLERESLTNIEEDGGAARKLRSAGLAMHGKFHRARKGFEKDAELESPSQDLLSRRKFSTSANGATVNLTLDPLCGLPENNSSTGLPLEPDPTTTTSVSVDQGGEVMDAGISIGDRDSDKQHLRNKAKGLFGKAAGQLSHQFSKNMNRLKKKEKEGPSSSEEVTTSGELTPMGGSGRLGPATKELGPRTEVSVTGPGVQQQLPPTSKKFGSSLPSAPIPSEPPHRPPPELPQPVAPVNLQADNEKIQSSQPLRPVPAYSRDAQESSFAEGQERSQTEGLPQPAPPAIKELEGARVSLL